MTSASYQWAAQEVNLPAVKHCVAEFSVRNSSIHSPRSQPYPLDRYKQHSMLLGSRYDEERLLLSSLCVWKQDSKNMSTPPVRRITIGGVPSKIVSIPRRISLSASGTSAVAIDNKIEQAMDLVKSHLMFAVREEVEVLKERISELMDRINQLEYENNILKANASQETWAQLTTGGSNVTAAPAVTANSDTAGHDGPTPMPVSTKVPTSSQTLQPVLFLSLAFQTSR
uniref:TSC22 domain family protein 1 n=1 Tax=Anopheles funestus TaxID=62324 RepID=A0A4Y0BJS7_ANOFN